MSIQLPFRVIYAYKSIFNVMTLWGDVQIFQIREFSNSIILH